MNTGVVEHIMKRGKSTGITTEVELATALYETMKEVERLKQKVDMLDSRTVGSIVLGGSRIS